MEKRIRFEKLDRNIPFFRDSIEKHCAIPEPSQNQKECVDKICKWLFSESDRKPPREALQFIAAMKILHKG